MKSVKILIGIFLVVGIGLLAIGAKNAKHTKVFLHAAKEVKAIVVELEKGRSGDSTTYAPVVEYVIEEQVFTLTSNTYSNPPSYHIGDEVSVVYDPQNFEKAKINSFFQLWGGSVIPGGIGVVLVTAMGAIIAASIRKKKFQEQLCRTGMMVQAKVTRVYPRNIKVNNRPLWRIEAQGHDPLGQGKEVVYKSNNLWKDPSDHVSVGDSINVYVDLIGSKKYWVDTSSL